MNASQTMKFVQLTAPETKNNGSFTTNTYVDTQGWDELLVVIQYGASDCTVGSTNAATTALLVEECDTSGGSYSDVTDAELSAVLANDGDNTIHAIRVNLSKSHKRYMRVQDPKASNNTGAGLAILGILSKKSSGTFAGLTAESGLTELVNA